MEVTEEGEVDLEAVDEKKATAERAIEAQTAALQTAATQHAKDATFQAEL